jgi:hypothetical protein
MRNLFRSTFKSWFFLASPILWLHSGLVCAAPTYVDVIASNVAPVADETILDFDAALALQLVDASNNGSTVAQRRGAMNLVDASGNSIAFSPSDSDLTDLTSFSGSANYYLYKYLNGDSPITGNTLLGTTGGASNKALILDLGESDLTVNGTIEGQGAHFVTTVNSFASSDGLIMDGTSAMGVDVSRTGQIIADELIEQTSGNPANFKLLLDMNSSLKDGANFVFAQETAGNANNIFSYSVTDAENSRLYDNSYVINSSAARAISGNDESVVVTFSRADDEYILKSNTRNHQSNDAALKLGTIAADGVALGDLQTALTVLDINDFGFGDTATNLATQVKRLAPIANNSAMISAFNNLELVEKSIDQRFSARRAHWSGYSDLNDNVWFKVHQQNTFSSGSVPVATPNAQDTAGHIGFGVSSQGITAGLDHRFKNGLVGVSSSHLTSYIDQSDDRVGERAVQKHLVDTVYSRLNNRNSFATLVYSSARGDTQGVRKTAIDRTASYKAPVDTKETTLKLGHRFDLSDGRSAITPFYRLAQSQFHQQAYTETGAGDLSLTLQNYKIDRVSQELGAEMTHKGRYFGAKGLSSLSFSVGKDRLLDDPTIYANYTGDTHAGHASYTTFTTPTESWAENVVKFRGMFQIEPWARTMVRMGLDLQARNSRQDVAVDFSIVKAF